MEARGGVTPSVASLLAALVLLSPLGTADWLQPGVDAAHSNASPDSGPATDDVAYRVAVPGMRSFFSAPLVVGDVALVLTTDDERSFVHRVELDSARAERVLTVDGWAPTMASDGERLFVTREGVVEAFSLESFAPAWSWSHDYVHGSGAIAHCTSMAVTADAVYLSCYEIAYLGGADYSVVAFAVALDAATGEMRWRWVKAAGEELGARPGDVAYGATTRSTRFSFPLGLSAIGTNVVLITGEYRNSRSTPTYGAVGSPGHFFFLSSYDAWALDAASGGLEWRVNTSAGGRAYAMGLTFPPAPLPVYGDGAYRGAVVPTGTSTIAFLRFGDVLAVNPSRGSVLWRLPLGEADATSGDNAGGGLALRGDALYANSLQTFYRIDTRTREPAWAFTLDPALAEYVGAGLPVLGRDALFARTEKLDGSANVVYALDADDGLPRWRHEFPVPAGWNAFRFVQVSLAGERLVALDLSGNLTVLGRSAASIAVDARPSDAYPAVGENVTVDASGTRAGAFGPATEYRAEWGDGAVTEWQESPLLAHAFAEAGTRTVRVQARNAEGQSASAFVTLNVGQEPPPELNVMQRAFAPENQERTFFLLGLLVTGAGGLVGVARLESRRRRLQRELAAVERAFEATRARPPECEAALNERKAHARGLLLDGKLEEAQFAIVEKRVDELARKVRLGTLDRRFEFLPLGMVNALREMLNDGHISAWEHRHFLDALERDELLTREQKEKVRALIDSWFERDSGA